MSTFKLWLSSTFFGVVSAILYGIIHDQISIRISPPYLMDWHPTIIESRDPTTVALAWGVVATWWFGLILGMVLALAATVGRRPSAHWTWIFRAVCGVFAATAIGATVAYGITRSFGLELPAHFDELYSEMPQSERQAFTQTAAMHETSYDVAGVATLIASVLIYRSRKARLTDAAPESGSPTV